MSSIRRIVAAIAVIGVASCSDDGVGPRTGASDQYVLRSVAGQTLPAAYVIGNYASVLIIADTMRFGADGRGTEVFISRTTYADGGMDDIRREDREFQYRVVEGNLEIEFPCPDLAQRSTASCIAPPHYRGEVSDGGIRFDTALSYPTPMLFDRVGSRD